MDIPHIENDARPWRSEMSTTRTEQVAFSRSDHLDRHTLSCDDRYADDPSWFWRKGVRVFLQGRLMSVVNHRGERV